MIYLSDFVWSKLLSLPGPSPLNHSDQSSGMLEIAKSLMKCEDLKLIWEVLQHSQLFLDMLIHIDSISTKIEWKPYHKARNHLEHIPLDVKRGTFLGEMSCLAVLCVRATTKLYTPATSKDNGRASSCCELTQRDKLREKEDGGICQFIFVMGER